jgi:hypothetical protein
MNIKIIKLALDANLLDYVEHETPRNYFISGNADVEDVIKFANLIIEECIISATTEMISSGFDSYDELTEYERGCDDTAALIASRIKDKFKI